MTHSWHAALGGPSSQALGIVWIGRKGMYGLKEHGYSRPDKDIFESVAEIVERLYFKTRLPVQEGIVMAELSRQRREVQPNSVKMALSFNDRLELVGTGRYVSKNSGFSEPGSTPTPQNYDISAAVEAFSTDDDAN